MKNLILLMLVIHQQTSMMSEYYKSYKLNAFQNQVHSSYLVSMKAKVTEIISSTTNQTFMESTIPVEFIREISQLTDLPKFSFTMGFGNYALVPTEISNLEKLPNSGMVFRVFTNDKSKYLRFVKLMSGFFNTEMARPSTDFLKLQDLKNRDYFYYNCGLCTLNFNNFIKINQFVNNKDQFSLLNAVHLMKIFESDYVSFSFEFSKSKRIQGEFEFKFGLNLILREVVLNNLFHTNNFYVPRNFESSFFGEINLKEENNLNGEIMRQFVKKSPSILGFSSHEIKGSNYVFLSMRNVVPVFMLQHKMMLEIENKSDEAFDFKLDVVFKASEYPILSQHKLEIITGNVSVHHKQITKWREANDRISGQVVSWFGKIQPKSHLVITIPYQQIHRNFEFVESDHLIANVIPSSLLQLRDSQNKTNIMLFKNIAYKTKNYDTTIVFAVLTIYLIIFFFTFNAITKVSKE